MILEKIENYLDEGFSKFHMPGHKGSINFKYDLTEIDNTDDLYDSNGSIKFSEDLVSKIYGSGVSSFSTQGNTLCIQAMIYLAVPYGGKMIVPSNVHKSVINTMGLLNISPIWVNVDSDKNADTNDIEIQLKNDPDVDAIFITSPDYFGNIVDIKKIKSMCGNIPLLVDNSHGSHLIFFDCHPISLGGADLCADSAHKTLPVLTGGAWLGVGKSFSENNHLYYEDVKNAMQIFSSTSPSFLTLVSLEQCALWLESKGKEEFIRLKEKVDYIKNINPDIFLKNNIVDPVRITFDMSSIGVSSEDFVDHLEKFKIKPEFGVDNKVVLIPSPFNSETDWKRLELALKNIKAISSEKKYKKNEENSMKREFALSIHDAMFSKFDKIDISECCGRISAQIISKCPPGIPIVIPGEVISPSQFELIQNLNLKSIRVVKND